jgi:hypothetical protein
VLTALVAALSVTASAFLGGERAPRGGNSKRRRYASEIERKHTEPMSRFHSTLPAAFLNDSDKALHKPKYTRLHLIGAGRRKPTTELLSSQTVLSDITQREDAIAGDAVEPRRLDALALRAVEGSTASTALKLTSLGPTWTAGPYFSERERWVWLGGRPVHDEGR